MGHECTKDDECEVGLFCPDGECINLFSGNVGHGCTVSEECRFGLICNTSGACAVPPSQMVPCANDTDCTESYGVDAFCYCFNSGGDFEKQACVASTVIPAPASCSQWPSLLGCAISNRCYFEPILTESHTDTCLQTHCSSSLNCVLNCIVSNAVYEDLQQAGCFTVDFPCTLTTGTTSRTTGTTGAATTGPKPTTGTTADTTGSKTTGSTGSTTGEKTTGASTTGRATTGAETTGEGTTGRQTTTGEETTEGHTTDVFTTGSHHERSSATQAVLSLFLVLLALCLF